MRPYRNSDSRITQEQARTQLHLLLNGATDERVDGLTVELLRHQYRIPPREIECMLLAEQAKRRRLAAERAA